MSYLSNKKKRILKIRRLELVLEGGTDRRTSRRCQNLLFIFFIKLKNKGKWAKNT